MFHGNFLVFRYEIDTHKLFTDILLQDMEKCSPKGRDCFEKHSSQTFNCSATCEGVYADVLWEEDTIMKEEEVMKEMERHDNTD